MRKHCLEQIDKKTNNCQQIYVRENRMGNQEWTIQSHWLALVTQDTRQRETMQKNIAQKTKKMSYMDPTINWR